ncbi:hypothetical protein M011DRAFT_15660 [Sporormia fimetaria CBS 119925]|uniref:Uncharacterized protein n=1 Tax=Sporormia fimetaria CBS 119925 TaxID=1340428 RepID=A0A6A6VN86_9PLEO|nr:hypothetical protein M011DRAFT_15660 [Sporormia fimetaria CBS 119925]
MSSRAKAPLSLGVAVEPFSGRAPSVIHSLHCALSVLLLFSYSPRALIFEILKVGRFSLLLIQMQASTIVPTRHPNPEDRRFGT